MCTPEAALATLGMKLGTGIANAFGAKTAGEIQGKYYDFLASTSEENAKMAGEQGETQKTNVSSQAALQTQQVQGAGESARGSALAVMAAQGVSSNSVTAENIQESSLTKQQQDENAIRYSADLANWGIGTSTMLEMMKLKQQASEQRFQAESARDAGTTNMISGILGTVADVGQSAVMMNQVGAFKGLGGGPNLNQADPGLVSGTPKLATFSLKGNELTMSSPAPYNPSDYFSYGMGSSASSTTPANLGVDPILGPSPQPSAMGNSALSPSLLNGGQYANQPAPQLSFGRRKKNYPINPSLPNFNYALGNAGWFQ